MVQEPKMMGRYGADGNCSSDCPAVNVHDDSSVMYNNQRPTTCVSSVYHNLHGPI